MCLRGGKGRQRTNDGRHVQRTRHLGARARSGAELEVAYAVCMEVSKNGQRCRVDSGRRCKELIYVLVEEREEALDSWK